VPSNAEKYRPISALLIHFGEHFDTLPKIKKYIFNYIALVKEMKNHIKYINL